jgi:aminopeptidase N
MDVVPGMNLTHEEARTRSELLSVSSYDVSLDVTGGPETFTSRTVVRFSCNQAGAASFIDLVARSVSAVTLNGQSLDPTEVFDGVRLQLPELAAENVLDVTAEPVYMNTGEGLHRFVDPVDDEVYLYSQFEVADSRRVFAVFEQPDLKATFTFTVTAPEHWTVVSVNPTPEPEPAGSGTAVWRFEPTPLLSSYVTAVIAGPYHVERREHVSRDGRVIPLAVYCRRSLADHLDTDEIVQITTQGFSFFEEMFDLPYPFAKYDQLFVPEFNAGAMENAGAVTFLETYVFRSEVPQAIIERRALTILHELAHMWFGDLVTMRWWNDLWLNESFAEWASTVAQAEATRWPWAWTTFSTAEKSWAYRQDQLGTTHPIVALIRDLEDVEVNFDGITYAKGASVLKQLVAYVGRDEFVQGLRRYFKAHAWRNTELADLLRELEVTSGRDLASWSADWLQQAGVNTLRPVVEVDDSGVITAVSIEQSAPESHPILREHRLAIGGYDLRDGKLVRTTRVELDVRGESTPVTELVGRPRPDLLLVNDDDLAYAKIRLDQHSLATAVDHLDAFDSSMPRALILGASWDMTRDAEMAPRDFVELVLDNVAAETDSSVQRILLAQMNTASRFYSDPTRRAALDQVITAQLRELTLAAEPGSDAQLQLLTAYAGSATSASDTAYVRDLLEGEQELPGRVIDTDLRWALLGSLVAAGAAAPAEIEAELERDNTAAGQRHAASARAAIPTPEAKLAAWNSVVDNDDLPNALQEAAILGFGRVHDAALLEPFVEKYFESIGPAWQSRTNDSAQKIVVGLFPVLLSSPALAARTQAWLDGPGAEPDTPPSLVRLVSENRDTVVRAVRAQERDAQA